MRRDQTFKTASIAGASDLTILAPIKKGLVPALDAVTYKTRVKRVLRLLHIGRTTSHEYEMGRVLSDAVERVGKIHSIRIAVLEPEDKVLLVVTFDGAWESYIRVIWQKVSRLLDLIFCNTEGYKLGWESSYDEWCAWLRSAQAETLFLYSQPNLTNTDTHYLKSIERIHRKEVNLTKADRAIAEFKMPTAEENAESILNAGIDLTNWTPTPIPQTIVPTGPAFRQGVRTLIALYRLSDVYLSNEKDGAILHRAAQELLIEFREMLKDEDDFSKFEDRIDEIKKHYADAWDWFFSPMDHKRSIPELPEKQDDLILRHDIQGGILQPYKDTTDGCLLLVSFKNASGMANFLESFVPTSIETQDTLQPGQIAQNIAITSEGMRLAGFDDAEISEMPEEFIQGMDKRQAILGDLYMNHPRRWRLPAMNWSHGVSAIDEGDSSGSTKIQLSSVHAVIQLRLRFENSTQNPKEKILEKFKQILGYEESSKKFTKGVVPLSLQWMHRLKDEKGEGIEHFGYREAESNPIYNSDKGLTEFKNQVHIGEVIHGHPNSADHGVPANGAKSQRAKSFLRNGSFLVIRKLRQDVGILNKIKNQVASSSEEMLMAKMMGRYPANATAKDSSNYSLEGHPLNPTNSIPNPPNNFNFSSDISGKSCPFHAHIRRANPREDQADLQNKGERTPRIVRRGMSYGDRYIPSSNEAKDTESLNKERGLIFMAYNASIGEQFEVIQRWLAGGNSTGSYSGQSDPILGVAEPGRPRFFQYSHNNAIHRVALDGSDEVHGEISPLVRLEWGVYLFAPSLSALKKLRQRALQLASSQTIEWSVDEGEKYIHELQSIEERYGKAEAKQSWKAALEDPDSTLVFKTASIWAAIRHKYGGVLQTPFGILVGSQRLADQVLLDSAKNLTAEEYLPLMRDSFGELYLGMDTGRDDKAYERESDVPNAAVLKLGRSFKDICDEVEGIVHQEIAVFVEDAKQAADDLGESKWQTTIDIRILIEKVIGHFCEIWFGLKDDKIHFKRGGVNWHKLTDSDLPRYPGHFMAPSRYVFQPHPSDTVRDVAKNHGNALSRAMTAHLIAHREELISECPLVKDILLKGDALADGSYAARTLLGLMMGFVPTTDGLTRRITIEWLREGTLWKLRELFTDQANMEWKHADLINQFNQAFNHAFLLRAAPELLWRTVTREHQIGEGAYAVDAKVGEKIVVGQISATHEGIEDSSSDSFMRAYAYAFGDSRKNLSEVKPTHACPGNRAAMAVMWGFLKSLVTCAQPMRSGQSSLSFVVEGELVLKEKKRKRSTIHDWSHQSINIGLEEIVSGEQTELFAMGDSWVFQFDMTQFPRPFFNLVSAMKREAFSFTSSSSRYPNDYLLDEVFNYAGAKLEEMPNKEMLFVDRMKDLKKAGKNFKAILLSAGGNDITSYEKKDQSTSNLFKILNPNASSIHSCFNLDAKNNFFNKLRENYVSTFKMLLKHSQVPIVIHGYDYPIPSDLGVNLGFYRKGPWLKPVFTKKNIGHDLSLIIMRQLIDEMNDMIQKIIAEEESISKIDRERLHYLNLRGVFEKQTDFNRPENYWLNELHATEGGFDLLAEKIIEKLINLKIISAIRVNHK